jgi:hypothetical protein
LTAVPLAPLIIVRSVLAVMALRCRLAGAASWMRPGVVLIGVNVAILGYD